MDQKPTAGNEDGNIISNLEARMAEISANMERMRLAEYVEMLENPRRLLYINFVIGLARGFGTAIGFTILAGTVVWFLQKIVVLNLPVVSNFIADIVKMVQTQL